jgi:hypothetical protein
VPGFDASLLAAKHGADRTVFDSNDGYNLKMNKSALHGQGLEIRVSCFQEWARKFMR